MTKILAQRHIVSLVLGVQTVNPAFDAGRLFEYRICNTDSTRASKIDYFEPKVTICANIVEDEEHLEREATAALVRLYDFYRSDRETPTCTGFACSTIRVLRFNNICRNAEACYLDQTEAELRSAAVCQGENLRQAAAWAYGRCLNDRAPLDRFR